MPKNSKSPFYDNCPLGVNDNTSKAISIIATYKPLTMPLFDYLVILKENLKSMLTNCPTFILGGLNVDMLMKNLFLTMLRDFMISHNLHIPFSKSTFDCSLQLNHMHYHYFIFQIPWMLIGQITSPFI